MEKTSGKEAGTTITGKRQASHRVGSVNLKELLSVFMVCEMELSEDN